MRISDWSSDVCSSDLSCDRSWSAAVGAQALVPYLFQGLAVKPLQLPCVRGEVEKRETGVSEQLETGSEPPTSGRSEDENDKGLTGTTDPVPIHRASPPRSRPIILWKLRG